MSKVAKFLFIVLSAAVAALLVLDYLDLGDAHARGILLPLGRDGVVYD